LGDGLVANTEGATSCRVSIDNISYCFRTQR